MANTQHQERYDIIIIGGGPAGIFLSIELKTHSTLNVLMLEKESSLASSWLNMPDYLTLVSPWYCNKPSLYRKFFSPFYRMPAKEYAKELLNIAITFDLPYKTKCEVLNLKQVDDGFNIETNQGNMRSKVIVNATGYYSNPMIPDYKGIKSSAIPILHFKDFKNENSLPKMGSKILIIGKRISAGQLIVLLHKNYKLSISSRSPISFGPNEFIWSILFPLFPIIEQFFCFLGITKPPGPVSMFGGLTKKLIQSGKVKTLPDIVEIKDKSILFQDGKEFEFDGILLTTGFKFRDFVPQVNNYYSLGKEGLYDFRSRFLRGIKNDAQILANKIIGSFK